KHCPLDLLGHVNRQPMISHRVTVTQRAGSQNRLLISPALQSAANQQPPIQQKEFCGSQSKNQFAETASTAGVLPSSRAFNPNPSISSRVLPAIPWRSPYIPTVACITRSICSSRLAHCTWMTLFSLSRSVFI